MELIAALCLAGILVTASGFSVSDKFDLLIPELELEDQRQIDVPYLRNHEDGGHCQCSKWGCWCHGFDADVPIHAVFMVDQTVFRCTHTVIEATVFIGKLAFSKQFEADKFEDFCETVSGIRFCFRIDIHDLKKKDSLNGCLSMSRPHKAKLGCFKLPLMAAKIAGEVELGQDAGGNNFEESDETMLNFKPYVEMVASSEEIDAGAVGKQKHACICCEHGCTCKAEEDGLKVVVILSVDEVNHKDKNGIIDGFFRIGEVAFTKELDANGLSSFCHSVSGKEFCFRFRNRECKNAGVHTCMALTKPKKINLGCFHIPLMETDEYFQGSFDIDTME